MAGIPFAKGVPPALPQKRVGFAAASRPIEPRIKIERLTHGDKSQFRFTLPSKSQVIKVLEKKGGLGGGKTSSFIMAGTPFAKGVPPALPQKRVGFAAASRLIKPIERLTPDAKSPLSFPLPPKTK